MRTRKSKIIVEYVLRCTHCGRDKMMTDTANLDLGDVIYPAEGHGDYGRCIFCRKGGLKVVRRSDLESSS